MVSEDVEACCCISNLRFNRYCLKYYARFCFLLLLIASISVSAILVARNVITLYCINIRTLYHGPNTTDVRTETRSEHYKLVITSTDIVCSPLPPSAFRAYTCVSVARVKVKVSRRFHCSIIMLHNTRISTGCDDVTMLRLFLFHKPPPKTHTCQKNPNRTSLNENYVLPCICLRAILRMHDSCYSSVARHIEPCTYHIALRHIHGTT